MSLSPSRLNRQIIILRPVDAPDGTGGRVTTWVPVCPFVWAEVLGISGREAVLDHVLQGNSVYKVTIRYRADTEGQESFQLRYGSLDLNIQSAADPDGRREQLVIIAETASAQPTS